ncbi:putative membrane protein YphA (DoxX/SURF4 family) [Flavobacterium nitrogenifigens]|uniref:Membrane protein YphA (DoxX/SURF4 family) n=2 Tax=Flavobacterium TaxID=237 RepID=A0ABR6QER9_9FLAO|nr:MULTISPECIES: DoxX family membrane protein [Flavobacterium]MBB4802777.1 putative membrane protein YphA (DoxX/SURF4 family) [Flavobacterium nitrogenifigens]MBB6387735.1 putative membrane protein YphA (DoxX/SURF4 family) [Flavobacterium notoginsengisoli]
MKNITILEAGLILRIVLAITMLSAVADRFGIWGAPGSNGVAWGNWENFVIYTNTLNPYANKATAEILGAAATFFEVLLSLLLLFGFKTRIAALGTTVLLFFFGFAMAVSVSVKAPLDYSVWTSAAAALLLANIGKSSFAVDNRI